MPTKMETRKAFPCEKLGAHRPGADQATLCWLGYEHPGPCCLKLSDMAKANQKCLKAFKMDAEYAQRIADKAAELGVTGLENLKGTLFPLSVVDQQHQQPSMLPHFEILGLQQPGSRCLFTNNKHFKRPYKKYARLQN